MGQVATKEVEGGEHTTAQEEPYTTRRNHQSTPTTSLPASEVTQGELEFDFKSWASNGIARLAQEGLQMHGSGFIFKHLTVTGAASTVELQATTASVALEPVRKIARARHSRREERVVLHNLSGVVKDGELLAVLGRPGSGCSTFLKSISGRLNGLHVGKDAEINFNGIPFGYMHQHFKGEVTYNPALDYHFPHLTVRQTLEFAAALRTPRTRFDDMSRDEWAHSVAKAATAMCGLTGAYDTPVGDEFIRGVSGGERKRVTIAEMAVAGSSVGLWDEATRGLDSGSALSFVRSLRNMATVLGSSHAVSLYQASDSLFTTFDKVIVLYEGREVYFGSVSAAKTYFEDMGWTCAPRQPVADFLTSVTNPAARKARAGWENRTPRTAEEFERYWLASEAFQSVTTAIEDYEHQHPEDGKFLPDFQQAMAAKQSKHVRRGTPYHASIRKQIHYCTKRAFYRVWQDKLSTVTIMAAQVIMSLILGSMFYQTPDTTVGLFSKGAVLFAAILLNAIITVTDIFQVYRQRPIVEKQASYAFYQPWTEALSALAIQVPLKLAGACTFNVIIYFLAGLRTKPSQFFIFFLFVYVATITMSCIFRAVGSATRSQPQAFAIVGVVLPLIVIYTGFVIPQPSQRPWFKWITYINPVQYTFEALIANEFHGREFNCTTRSLVPPYGPVFNTSYACAVRGAKVDEPFVSGDSYIDQSYDYHHNHVWRNFGILVGYLLFFLLLYLVFANRNMYTAPTSNDLVFRRGQAPKASGCAKPRGDDVEKQADVMCARRAGTGASENPDAVTPNGIRPQTDTFTWESVSYAIPVRNETKILLDDVYGWVKPGTLTALMGVSGAGKTTLLDTLAQRMTVGVVTGHMLINGFPLHISFARSAGYVQQMDLHVETSTVREALRFSAILRQPHTTLKAEKLEYVEKVIQMLRMSDFADAVVDVPGHGLNVEQRKLLTIGVELAAKPAVLLFLDEPTSGLDSESAWGVVSFLRALADQGQTILCTIHQPSSVLFQQFDRLLLLTNGGTMVYFGDIGDNSRTVLNYFEQNGAKACGSEENPAEYMLEVIGPGSKQNWPALWKASPEHQQVLSELERIRNSAKDASQLSTTDPPAGEFAMPFSVQVYHVTKRAFQHYWRTPSYVWAKLRLCIASSLFIGFTFYAAKSSLQGIQNAMFGIFMQAAIFPPLVNQILPRFVAARSLYEVRERPSKAYSWKAFLLANVIVEIPYQLLCGVIVFACFTYPVLGILSPQRQGLILLFFLEYFVWLSTFAHMVVSALPDAETAAEVAIIMFILSLVFSGPLQPPSYLPQFWHFMWRASPLTYWISGIVSTGMSGRRVECAEEEHSVFDPPRGMNCSAYLSTYLNTLHAPGYLLDQGMNSQCRYCMLSFVDQYLAESRIYYGDRWRNFGLLFVYIGFNILTTVVLYYLFRVRRWSLRGLFRRNS